MSLRPDLGCLIIEGIVSFLRLVGGRLIGNATGVTLRRGMELLAVEGRDSSEITRSFLKKREVPARDGRLTDLLTGISLVGLSLFLGVFLKRLSRSLMIPGIASVLVESLLCMCGKRVKRARRTNFSASAFR